MCCCTRIVHAFNDNIVGNLRNGLNSACFVQDNHFLLCKSYEKTSGEVTLGRGETTLSWEETTWAKRP